MQSKDLCLEGLKKVLKHVGGQNALARLLSVAQPSVYRWVHNAQRIPAEHVLKIEKALNGKISRHEIRPDIYPIE